MRPYVPKIWLAKLNNALEMLPKLAACLPPLLLAAGCCTVPKTIQPLYANQRTPVEVSEEEVSDLFQALNLVRRGQTQLLRHWGDPVPSAVHDEANKARQAIMSNEAYINALRSFKEVLERRYDALVAERHIYEAWVFGDR